MYRLVVGDGISTCALPGSYHDKHTLLIINVRACVRLYKMHVRVPTAQRTQPITPVTVLARTHARISDGSRDASATIAIVVIANHTPTPPRRFSFHRTHICKVVALGVMAKYRK